MFLDPLIATAFFLYGLAFGSFANVCIHRLPRRIIAQDALEDLEQRTATDPVLRETNAAELKGLAHEIKAYSVAGPRSACPACKAPIRWYDNIPLVSWLVLGARCRRCRAPISWRYPAVELITGLLFLACYARFGLGFSAVKFCALSFLLVALIFTDAEWHLLPDALTLPGLGIGLALSLLAPVNDLFLEMVGALGLAHIPAASPRLASLGESVAGAVVGASFVYGAGMLYKRARGIEGMGLGDVKLMAMIGAFLGIALTVFTLFAASLVGSMFGLATVLRVWTKRTQRRIARGASPAAARRRAWHSALLVYRRFELPFGVFLGAMALLAAFFGNALLTWYWERFL